PNHVVMVGIAFGINPDKQHIGDILVSKQLQGYDFQRVGTSNKGRAQILQRGDKVTASTKILSRLRATTSRWDKCKIEFGLMLSGEKLIDNVDFRDQLVDQFPEALGGEMEGSGLYVACTERHVNWVLIKGICDWADGNKKTRKQARQKLAAENA